MFMSERRGTSTDHLANVIQVIQLGRKTGVLTVERGEGAILEQGEITFARGQITQVRASHVSAHQALTWLNSWGTCRFAFVPAQAESTPGSASPFPPTQPLQETNPYLNTPSYHTQNNLRTDNPRQLPSGTFPPVPTNPRRIVEDDDALRLLNQAGLSRLHRHLFLLIDGKRTAPELVRLIGRRPEEVYRLLQELERIGIILQ